MKTAATSNTIRLGAGQILTGLAGYLSGTLDEAGAMTLAVAGLLQILQRLLSLRKESQAGAPAPPGPPKEFPGIDAGPPGAGA